MRAVFSPVFFFLTAVLCRLPFQYVAFRTLLGSLWLLSCLLAGLGLYFWFWVSGFSFRRPRFPSGSVSYSAIPVYLHDSSFLPSWTEFPFRLRTFFLFFHRPKLFAFIFSILLECYPYLFLVLPLSHSPQSLEPTFSSLTLTLVLGLFSSYLQVIIVAVTFSSTLQVLLWQESPSFFFFSACQGKLIPFAGFLYFVFLLFFPSVGVVSCFLSSGCFFEPSPQLFATFFFLWRRVTENHMGGKRDSFQEGKQWCTS